MGRRDEAHHRSASQSQRLRLDGRSTIRDSGSDTLSSSRMTRTGPAQSIQVRFFEKRGGL